MSRLRILCVSICFLWLANQCFAYTCPGCPSAVNDVETIAEAKSTVESILRGCSDLDVYKMNQITSQVVSGIAYRASFLGQMPTGPVYECEARWIEQAWISPDPRSPNVTCKGLDLYCE